MLVLVIVFQHVAVGGDRLKRGQAISRTRGFDGGENHAKVTSIER